MSKPLSFIAIVVLLGLAVSASAAQQQRYVVEVHDPPQSAIPVLSQLDIWGVDAASRTYTIAVTEPDLALLGALGIDYAVVFTAQMPAAPKVGPRSPLLDLFDFTQYHDLDATYAFIDALEADYPDIVKQYDLGPGWQGDHVVALKISDNVAQDEWFERGVFYVGCHHAREWITVEIPLYMALYLAENYGTDPYVTNLIDNLEIWIIPCLNPDGYRYCWDVDRWWRKNRRPPTGGCWGVDPNRNYGYKWGGQGSSGDPCSETYRGPYAFSEPETQYVKQLIESHPNILACLSLHNYGEEIMYPWGYTYDACPDEPLHIDIGTVMRNRIHEVHGLWYTLMQESDLYLVSGGTDDWVYGDRGMVGFTYEVRPVGWPYFELPPEEIIPTCEEILPAALYLSEWLLANPGHAPADWLWPGWNWFSVPIVPDDATPDDFLGFDCSGLLWRFDRYEKAPIVYKPPFTEFGLQVGEGYMLRLDEEPILLRTRFEGTDPGSGFETRLGRMGWAWVGKSRMGDLTGSDFMQNVMVKYPSDESGSYRTAAQDRASGSPWLSWGWSWWDGELQAARTFTPYAPFGDRTCIPWRGYRAYANIGTAMSEDDPAQVTLIWP